MQRGDCLRANRQTVGEFAQEWLVTIAPTVRPSTLDRYQRDLRRARDPERRVRVAVEVGWSGPEPVVGRAGGVGS
jgi:hypothetical protein